MIFIGEASKLSGATVKAIRHYENIGLLPNLGRSGSYRTFSKDDIDIIRLIKEAQKVGFKLSEFKEIFESNASSSWAKIQNVICLKESQIKKEIAILKEKQLRLKQYSTLILDCLAEDPNCSKSLIEQVT
ncbi:MAG: DNA-binding transcriptional MerR regulator [Gammaproteobacteria bacterium]|jgi:DNA-binding transcriptional MerR regulator